MFTQHVRAVQVDWSRFHLQVMFVDRHDESNARIAQGLFDSIAEWNGFGRALYSWTAGLQERHTAPETSVSLMMRANSLGLPVKTFSRQVETLEMDDLYRNDIVVCLDRDVEHDARAVFDEDLQADWDSEADREYYRQRICSLVDFASYASSEQLSRRGGSALVPSKMGPLVESALQEGSAISSDEADIPEVALSEVQQWNQMVCLIALCTSGLVQYLVDSFPADLHYFWLE
jgi:hypothetical protein